MEKRPVFVGKIWKVRLKNGAIFVQNQKKMKKQLILTLLLLTAGLSFALFHYHRRASQLALDRHTLLARLELLQHQHDTLTAHCEVLRLDRDEFRRLYHTEAEQLRKLNIRLRRVESLAKSVTQSHLVADAPLRDTLRTLHRDTLPPLLDTLRRFTWSDPWNRIEGVISRDSVRCEVRSIDTLHQIVHRIPHRFLFIRWGTKALRQEIHSTNPSTHIIYTDYLIIER